MRNRYCHHLTALKAIKKRKETDGLGPDHATFPIRFGFFPNHGCEGCFVMCEGCKVDANVGVRVVSSQIGR